MRPPLSVRSPAVLLIALMALHLALGLHHQARRGGMPAFTNHLGFKNVVELRRLQQGVAPITRAPHPGKAAFFLPPEQTPPQGGLKTGLGIDPNLTYWVRAPLPFAFGATLSRLFPTSPIAPGLWPLPYLMALFAALYGIGSRVGGGWLGLLAATLASGYPAVFGFARLQHDALPLAAFALVTVWALMTSDGLKKPMACLAAGLALWLGLLSGESVYGGVLVALIAAGPAAMEGLTWLEARGSGGIGRWVGPALVALPTLALVDLSWLVASVDYMLLGFEDVATAPKIQGDWAPAAAQALQLGGYLPWLAGDLLRPGMSLWALVGISLVARAPAARRQRWALGLMVAIPLIALSIMTRKATWYAAPMAPAVALLTAVGLSAMPPRLYKAASAGAALTALGTLLLFSLAPDPWRTAVDGALAAPLRRLAPMRAAPLTPPLAFEGITVQRAAAATTASLRATSPTGPIVIGLIAPERYLAHAFRYLVELQDPDIYVLSLLDRNLLETGYAHLGPDSFDSLIYVTANGASVWPMEVGARPDDFQWRAPWPELRGRFGPFVDGVTKSH